MLEVAWAGPTGLEPATSALTGQRSNQAELRSQVEILYHSDEINCSYDIISPMPGAELRGADFMEGGIVNQLLNLNARVSLASTGIPEGILNARPELRDIAIQGLYASMFDTLPGHVTAIDLGSGVILRRDSAEEGEQWDLKRIEDYGAGMARHHGVFWPRVLPREK